MSFHVYSSAGRPGYALRPSGQRKGLEQEKFSFSGRTFSFHTTYTHQNIKCLVIHLPSMVNPRVWYSSSRGCSKKAPWNQRASPIQLALPGSKSPDTPKGQASRIHGSLLLQRGKKNNSCLALLRPVAQVLMVFGPPTSFLWRGWLPW